MGMNFVLGIYVCKTLSSSWCKYIYITLLFICMYEPTSAQIWSNCRPSYASGSLILEVF